MSMRMCAKSVTWTMMRTKTRMLGLDVTTTIVADGFTTGVLDLTKSQADVENSFASTAES